LITLKAGATGHSSIEIPRVPKSVSPRARIETSNSQPSRDPDPTLVQALARAHAWRNALGNGTYQSIDQLAAAVQWNAKVIRKLLRLAFLAPDIAEAILLGTQAPSLNVSELQGVAAYSWAEQRRLLRFAQGAWRPVCLGQNRTFPVARVMSAPLESGHLASRCDGR
jgi:hypothetical protein